MSDVLSYRVLTCTRVHPNAVEPYRGLFNYRSLSALATIDDVNLDVMVPVPRAPPVGPHSDYNNIPTVDSWPQYKTRHPRFLYPIPKRLFKYTVAARTFRRSVQQCATRVFDVPNIVHAGHLYFDGYGMLQYCRKFNLRLTVMGRGHILNNYKDLQATARRKIKQTLNYASGVFCVSEALAEIASELTDRKKVSVLPNGANPARFPTENAVPIRRELDIPEDETVVLFVGSFTRRKGVAEMAAILPELDLPNTIFLFVGHHGNMHQTLRRAVTDASVNARIYWELSPLALRRLYAIADLLMLPSYAEGRPNVIYEAMASETAVLASDIDGIREQVVDGTTGVLISSGDAGALVTHLRELISDPSQLEAMGQAGRERLRNEGWTWEQHAETLAAHHSKLLTERPDPGKS